MRKLLWTVLVVSASGLVLLRAQVGGQQTILQTVKDNSEFFEHLFTSLAMTSGVHQQAYLNQLRLSRTQGEIVLKIAAQFRAEEDALRQQAETALSEKKPDMDSKLAQIRSQRSELLVQRAVQIMRELGTEGSSRIIEHVERVAAARPKRVRE